MKRFAFALCLFAFSTTAYANCENYEDGSSDDPAPKAILCYKGKCDHTTVSYECGNIHNVTIGYANGLVIDNGAFENKYGKMNAKDWFCIEVTEGGCDATFWNDPKRRSSIKKVIERISK